MGGKRKGGGGKDDGFDYASFDIDAPRLPEEISEIALTEGGYPYDKKMKLERYEKELHPLQIELLKLQASLEARRERLAIVVEGRDAAGKGGVIAAMTQHLNPRHATVVALAKPTESEQGQWYFQRYIAHLPSAGSASIFDRSWYNRAAVEPVMGFCTPAETAAFLEAVPQLEAMLVRDGIRLIKLFLSVNRATQLKRLHTRHHDPLKQWKLSPIDLKGLGKWDDYTAAFDTMLEATHTSIAPWTVVRTNDKYRGRLGAIRHVLSVTDYEGKDKDAIGKPDPLIVRSGGEPLCDR